MKKILSILMILAVVIGMIGVQTQPGFAEEDDTGPIATTNGQAGTTLIAYVSANGHLTRTYQWAIEKSVAPESWVFFTGDSGVSAYTVNVQKTGYVDEVSVSGQVTVFNGGERTTEGLQIVVSLHTKSGGEQYASTGITQTITPAAQLDALETGTYYYAMTFTPELGHQYKIVADITITNHSGYLEVPFGPSPKADFSVPVIPDIEVHSSVTVTDNGKLLGVVSGEGNTFNYQKTFTCADVGTYYNTATIAETGQSASASVTVACHDLAVSKTVATSYNRYYSWTIDKEADQSSLILSLGQTYDVNYHVTLDATFMDADFIVSGNITVHNPAPMAAEIVAVTDLMGGESVIVECGVEFPYLLEADGSLVCTYHHELEENYPGLSNTATAELQNYAYDPELVGTPSGTTLFTSAPVNVVWGAEPDDLIDECVTVSDTMANFSGPYDVCYTDLSWDVSYQVIVGPYELPGTYYVNNIASFITNDTWTEGSDSWTVIIEVPGGGCTLTQGYWKTHSDAWGGIDPTATFFNNSESYSYITILWTPPAKGSAYIQLAHQYIAAKLNINNGAYPDAEVYGWIMTAEGIFGANTDMILKGGEAKAAKVLAYHLDQFNNGYVSVPHCTE